MKNRATFHQVGLNSQVSPYVIDANDPAFAQDISKTYFNLGAGLFYYTEKYYVGVSVPNFLKQNTCLMTDVTSGMKLHIILQPQVMCSTLTRALS